MHWFTVQTMENIGDKYTVYTSAWLPYAYMRSKLQKDGYK